MFKLHNSCSSSCRRSFRSLRAKLSSVPIYSSFFRQFSLGYQFRYVFIPDSSCSAFQCLERSTTYEWLFNYLSLFSFLAPLLQLPFSPSLSALLSILLLENSVLVTNNILLTCICNSWLSLTLRQRFYSAVNSTVKYGRACHVEPPILNSAVH
jgi:hypothetical protein